MVKIVFSGSFKRGADPPGGFSSMVSIYSCLESSRPSHRWPPVSQIPFAAGLGAATSPKLSPAGRVICLGGGKDKGYFPPELIGPGDGITPPGMLPHPISFVPHRGLKLSPKRLEVCRHPRPPHRIRPTLSHFGAGVCTVWVYPWRRCLSPRHQCTILSSLAMAKSAGKPC